MLPGPDSCFTTTVAIIKLLSEGVLSRVRRLVRSLAVLGIAAVLFSAGVPLVQLKAQDAPPADAELGTQAPREEGAESQAGPPGCCRVEPPLDFSAIRAPSRRDDLGLANRTLRLEDAIDVALAKNPDIVAVRIRGGVIQAYLDESRAPFLPSLSLTTGRTEGNYPHIIGAYLQDSHELTPDVNMSYPGRHTFYNMALEARWNIFNGGRDLLRRRMFETGMKVCANEQAAVRNMVIGQVVECFFSVLEAKERQRTASDGVESARADYDEVRARFDLGATLPAELGEAELARDRAEAAVATADLAHLRALAALAVALGADADTPFDLADEESESRFDLPGSFDSALDRALARRPELERARLMVRRYELAHESTRAEYLPRLDAYLIVDRFRHDNGFPSLGSSDRIWLSSFLVSWPIFDGGAREARMARARAELDEQLATERKATLEVQRDVREAWLWIEEAKVALALAEKAVTTAEATKDMRQVRWQAGAETVARYLESAQALREAMFDRAAARYQLRKAHANAARAIGEFARTAEAPETGER